MRKVLLTLLSFILVHSLFSQQDSVLKKFKYRIPHYQAITINAGGGGQYDKSDFGAGTSKTSAVTGNAGGSYYFIKSTDRILLNVFGSLSSSFNSGKFKTNSSDNKSSGYNTLVYFNISNKWFSKKFFTELSANAASVFTGNKATYNNPPQAYKSNDLTPGLAVTLGIGKGRLENITDMQNALWLYKALTTENKFSRDLSADELNELGRTITKSNSTRVLDARKRTQFILETIDQFFQQKGLINATDIRYFSNLNDIVFFAFNNARQSGTEKFIRVTPGINYFSRNQDQSNSEKYENRITTKSVTASAGINHYHPVSLVHQNNMGASIVARYLTQDYNEKFITAGTVTYEASFKPEIRQAGINAFFQHAVYPNTRTIATIGLSGETGYQSTGGESDFYGKVDLSGSLSYFISYRTRFNVNLGAAYLKNYYSFYQGFQLLPDHIQFSANAGIEIAL